MFRRILIFTPLLAASIFISCQDDIILPKLCTEEPDLPFTKARLSLVTDINSLTTITIDKKGHIIGDSISIKRNGILKNADIGGYICKEGIFNITPIYNDTLDNSILKIEGTFKSNLILGKIYYCSNFNNNCTFIQIGSINASYSGNESRGSFYSPMFNGEFVATTY